MIVHCYTLLWSIHIFKLLSSINMLSQRSSEIVFFFIQERTADKIDVCWILHFLLYKTWCGVSQMATNIYKVIGEFRCDWERNVWRRSAVGGTGVTKSDKSNLSCSRGLCWCRRALSLPHVMFADTSNKLHNPIPSLRSMAPTQSQPQASNLSQKASISAAPCRQQRATLISWQGSEICVATIISENITIVTHRPAANV